MNTFAEKVATMRKFQKKYFSERSGYILQQAKKAEREVDIELANMEQAQARQQSTLKFE